jgi:uncharacterized protein (DUF2164 family)
MAKPKFQMAKEKRAEMIALVKAYFLEEREEELGDLGASFLLDFFIDKIAPEFYNQGVLDSHKYVAERLEDLLGIQKL